MAQQEFWIQDLKTGNRQHITIDALYNLHVDFGYNEGLSNSYVNTILKEYRRAHPKRKTR